MSWLRLGVGWGKGVSENTVRASETRFGLVMLGLLMLGLVRVMLGLVRFGFVRFVIAGDRIRATAVAGEGSGKRGLGLG